LLEGAPKSLFKIKNLGSLEPVKTLLLGQLLGQGLDCRLERVFVASELDLLGKLLLVVEEAFNFLLLVVEHLF